jgi:threonine/homoserine/homoserine lactone efflux protein
LHQPSDWALSFQDQTLLYEGLRWAGFAFMLWLAFEAWQDASEASTAISDSPQHWRAYFRRGVLVNLLNPKAALLFIAIFPNFISDAGSPTLQAVILMALYLGLATAIHLLIVFGASSVRSILENQGLNRRIRRVLALLLVLVAFWIAYSAAR